MRGIAGAVLVSGSLAAAAVTMGTLLLDAFACPSTCSPNVAGLLAGLLVLTGLCGLAGLGVYLLWTAAGQARDRAVAAMAGAGAAAMAPTALLLIGARSSGLEPVFVPASALVVGLATLAAAARRRAVEPVLRSRVLATVVVGATGVLALLASM